MLTHDQSVAATFYDEIMSSSRAAIDAIAQTTRTAIRNNRDLGPYIEYRDRHDDILEPYGPWEFFTRLNRMHDLHSLLEICKQNASDETDEDERSRLYRRFRNKIVIHKPELDSIYTDLILPPIDWDT